MNENLVYVSIIVPIYNTERYLKRCIDSCLNQTFKDFELILVDDGSTDYSSVICDEYAALDKRVRTFHKRNGGVASAKNFGIEQARGVYISFVDSDDFVDQLYLEKLIAINRGKNDLVIAGLRYLQESNLKVYDEMKVPAEIQIDRCDFNRYLYTLLKLDALNFHVAKLYKREIITRRGIRFTDYKETGGDDTVFNFDVLLGANTVCVSKSNIYNYVIYNSSTSHKYAGDKWIRGKRLDGILREKCEALQILDDNMNAVLNWRLSNMALWSAWAVVDSPDNLVSKFRDLWAIAHDRQYREAYLNTRLLFRYQTAQKYLFNHCFFCLFIAHKNYFTRFKGWLYMKLPRQIKAYILKTKNKRENNE